MRFTKNNNSEFYLGLREEFNSYFDDKKNRDLADWRFYLKAAILIAIYVTLYLLILFNCQSFIDFVLCYSLMGLTAVLVVFNFVHDASHKAISKARLINESFRYIGDLVGINTYIWDIRHNLQHHSFTNVLGGDLIIENIPLLRLSPRQTHKKFHRYQVYYAPLFYVLYSFYWIMIIDVKLFFKNEICNMKNIKHPLSEWIKLFMFKSLYIFYIIIVPWQYTNLTLSESILLFFIFHSLAGLLLSFVAVLGHFVEGPTFPTPINNEIKNSWAEHELDTTIDFGTNSRLINWITGGLNTHVAHHLFPTTCHIHYFELTKIIEEYCIKNGYNYKKESLFNALRSHFRYMKNLGANSKEQLITTPKPH